MKDIKLRYYGPIFKNVDIFLETYKEEYFEEELKMESALFYDLRKKNCIHPNRITDSSKDEKNEIKDFFSKHKNSFFFLIINNDIVGSVLILGNYIQSLCIKSDYQRQGYGEKLVKYAVNCILNNNNDFVELNIMNGNIAAEKLYSKIGFVKIN